MRVRILKSTVAAKTNVEAGDVVEVSDSERLKLVAVGNAEDVPNTTKLKGTLLPAVEPPPPEPRTRIRFLRGCVFDRQSYQAGDELEVTVRAAASLESYGNAQRITPPAAA